jgi:hypothetical protein
MVCGMRSVENVNEDKVEQWLESDVCELGFQHITDTDIVNAAMKQTGEEQSGGLRVKKKEKVVSTSVIAWCYSVLTLY